MGYIGLLLWVRGEGLRFLIVVVKLALVDVDTDCGMVAMVSIAVICDLNGNSVVLKC